MRSGTIREQDRVVWVGGEQVAPVGSSFKARVVTRTHVGLDDDIGDYDDSTVDGVRMYRRGTEVVSCREAAARGIEPWAGVFK